MCIRDSHYSSNAITIDFHYTDSVPDDLSLSKNPLFSSATWSGSTLSLKLKSGFLGYKAYYESDTGYLVFRCNNPPASMSSARIVIDPGPVSYTHLDVYKRQGFTINGETAAAPQQEMPKG